MDRRSREQGKKTLVGRIETLGGTRFNGEVSEIDLNLRSDADVHLAPEKREPASTNGARVASSETGPKAAARVPFFRSELNRYLCLRHDYRNLVSKLVIPPTLRAACIGAHLYWTGQSDLTEGLRPGSKGAPLVLYTAG